jgi:hypothetical protein
MGCACSPALTESNDLDFPACSVGTTKIENANSKKTSSRLMDIILDGGNLSSKQTYFKKLTLGNFLSV